MSTLTPESEGRTLTTADFQHGDMVTGHNLHGSFILSIEGRTTRFVAGYEPDITAVYTKIERPDPVTALPTEADSFLQDDAERIYALSHDISRDDLEEADRKHVAQWITPTLEVVVVAARKEVIDAKFISGILQGHYKINISTCVCGAMQPLGRIFPDHQADEVAKALLERKAIA